MICTFVEKKKKLLVLKHVGHQKCKASIPNIDAKIFYEQNLSAFQK
jgi:hypothetical protein